MIRAYHSIIFDYDTNDAKNTYDDFFLIPTSRPVFPPPPIKSVFIEIPGGQGSVDFTDAIMGKPAYDNRSGSFEFAVENYHQPWNRIYNSLMSYFDGRIRKAVLEDDPRYYYEGRFQLNEWNSQTDGTWSTVSIDFNVKPYRYSIGTGYWDSLKFEDETIENYQNLQVDGYLEQAILGHGEPVRPRIYYYQSPEREPTMRMQFSNAFMEVPHEFILQPGVNYLPGVLIVNVPVNQFVFYGHGFVTIEYTEARL